MTLQLIAGKSADYVRIGLTSEFFFLTFADGEGNPLLIGNGLMLVARLILYMVCIFSNDTVWNRCSVDREVLIMCWWESEFDGGDSMLRADTDSTSDAALEKIYAHFADPPV